MNKTKFRKSEVLSFLELKINDNVATEDELNLYETYVWENKFIKNDTYIKLVREMKRLWEVKF